MYGQGCKYCIGMDFYTIIKYKCIENYIDSLEKIEIPLVKRVIKKWDCILYKKGFGLHR